MGLKETEKIGIEKRRNARRTETKEDKGRGEKARDGGTRIAWFKRLALSSGSDCSCNDRRYSLSADRGPRASARVNIKFERTVREIRGIHGKTFHGGTGARKGSLFPVFDSRREFLMGTGPRPFFPRIPGRTEIIPSARRRSRVNV